MAISGPWLIEGCPRSRSTCLRERPSFQQAFSLASAREKRPRSISTRKSHVGQFAVAGTLTILDDAKLWIVDGQHRSHGVNYAYDRKGAIELADYPFPVTIMVGVDQYREMLHFNIINTTQRKMPTDIADRHLVQQAAREGLDMVVRGREKDYVRAKATRIVDALNEIQGPWFHNIAIPGVPGKEKGLVRQHAMVASLMPTLRDSWLAAREDEVVKLLAMYWNALAELWADAFESPKDYRVQATVGVYTMHGVFPSVVQLCLSERAFSQQKMKEMVEATGITSKFWHKVDGDPYTLGTGMASIRALTEYIKGELPAFSAVGL